MTVVKNLVVRMGDMTVEVEVVSEQPPVWSAPGTDEQRPVLVLRDLFRAAQAAGARPAFVIAPHVRCSEDGQPCDPPDAWRAWVVYASAGANSWSE
jgi:hypothetical protein